MSEAVPPSEPELRTDAPAGTTPAPEAPAGKPRGRKRRFVWRWSRRSLALAVALVAAFIVSFLTLDLGRIDVGGQSLRTLAEKYGSRYLERPLKVGAIRAYMAPGWYELRDVVIEGREPGDRPFLRASSIVVHIEWWALLNREIVVDVRMRDWDMVIERFADGSHNLPRFTPRSRSTGPRTFTTTVDFVYASDGEFRYDDHGAPWSVHAPNLAFNLVRARNLQAYVGNASFSGGAVSIQQFRPMHAEMRTRFTLDGPRVQLHHIDLTTDGAVSHVNGLVDFSKGPEMTYNVDSTIDFARMREIFFADAGWDVSGPGRFQGVFKLFRNGRDLSGQFSSPEVQLAVGGTTYPFPNLHGTLTWLPDRFSVTHADAGFAGGRTRLSYTLAPIGTPGGAPVRFAVDYRDVDLVTFSRLFDLAGLELDGRAAGHVEMTWPNGRFRQAMHGHGQTTVAPPAAVTLAPAALPESSPIVGPEPDFRSSDPVGRLAVGGDLRYRFEPGGLVIEDSWAATPATYVSFAGRTDYGEQTTMPFSVTSLDWQESDRVLVGIMRAFGRPTGLVEVGGRGTFDGTMTRSFRAPRVTGRFTADHMRAWDVTWGRAEGDLVIENGYLDLTNGLIGESPADASIRASGRFALGFPRSDGGQEIDGRIVIGDWPLDDFRHAFGLDDWPMEGTVGEADLRLRGFYTGPFGDGTLRIDNGRAWDEPFDRATGALTFEGTGLRISGLEIVKATGLVRGSTWIGWDNRYSFDVQSERPIPVESLASFAMPAAPLTGQLQFKASGASRFDEPRYEVSGSIADLAVGDEGIGPVNGQLSVADEVLALEVHVSSTRLAVDGNGTIALNDASDARLSFRFFNTSIDPYLKFVGPPVSPYARIVASGRIDVDGPLADRTRLRVETTLDSATVSLPDYDLTNDGPVELQFGGNAFGITRLKLRGEGTTLDVAGRVDVGADTVALTASGQANLAILQLFFGQLSTAGAASLEARLQGPLSAPTLTGRATITDGNVRHFALPHSLTAINGAIRFDATGVDVSGLRGRMGNGDVTFGGRITLAGGFRPDEFAITARGEAMRLRYPEGFASTVNADLALSGPVRAPTLSGTVDVISVNYRPSADQSASLLGLAGGAVGGEMPVAGPAAGSESGFPLLFDVRIQVPSMVLIQSRDVQVIGSANFAFAGPYDRPTFTGRVDLEGGEVTFIGNRYSIRPGYVEFTEAQPFVPVFDVEAVTRARTTGQTVEVTVRASGTFDRITPTITSDPWLPETDVVTLLLGGTADLGTAETRGQGSAAESQQRMMQMFGAAIVASPISDRVGSVFEQALPIETVQITPLFLGDELSLQRLNPSARITLGQRISSKVFLTYSRVLNTQDEIILVEYEQSSRVSWVLSRNEDRTFALDFRLRYVF